MSLSILAARTVSAFPLSIGTSLAFESLSDSGGTPYDNARIIPQHVELKAYDQLWINLSTLFRNIFGAVPSSESTRLTAEDCASVLMQEIEVINSIVDIETQGHTKAVYYVCNYQSLKSLTSAAQLRVHNTEKQITYYKLHDKTVQTVINHRTSAGLETLVFDTTLKPKKDENVLIFTHMAYDLVSYPKFRSLDLIESHTGILKKRNMWYTKLYQSEDLSMIPFMDKTIKFFGDSQTFKPFGIKARKAVMELGIKKRWTWATTKDKFLEDVKSLPDKFLSDTIVHL